MKKISNKNFNNLYNYKSFVLNIYNYIYINNFFLKSFFDIYILNYILFFFEFNDIKNLDELNLFNYDRALSFFNKKLNKISNFKEKFILRKYYYSFNLYFIEYSYNNILKSLLLISHLIRKNYNSIRINKKILKRNKKICFFIKISDLKILGEEGNLFFSNVEKPLKIYLVFNNKDNTYLEKNIIFFLKYLKLV